MKDFCSWSVLVFMFCGICAINGQSPDKGLIVTNFGSLIEPGVIQVFEGDTEFKDGKTINATRKSFADYLQLISVKPNVHGDSLIVLNAHDRTIYNYENFNLLMDNPAEKQTPIFTGVSPTYGHLAFDWLAQNVYWTDSYFDYIAVHPLRFENGTNSLKVIVKFLWGPEAIAVDPIKKYLFWSEVLGTGKCKVTRSNLAGDSSTHLDVIPMKEKKIRITTIALDSENERVYYSDLGRDTIEYCKYDGTGITTLVTLADSFRDITFAPGVICGTEFSYKLGCYAKDTGKRTWFSYDVSDKPWALTYWDKDKQKVQPHGCQNHNCDHICINTDEMAYKCLCKEGYKLKDDGMGCESRHGLLSGVAVAVASETKLCFYDVHIATKATPKPDCVLTNLTGLEYFVIDSHNGIVYYYDKVNSSIKMVSLLSKLGETLVSKTVGVTGMTYDWVNKKIYWTAERYVGMYDIYSRRDDDVYTGLNSPKDITINPHQRKLYWIEGPNGKHLIKEGTTDGQPAKVLLDGSLIESSSALVYDVTSERLYWNELKSVVSARLDGSNPTSHGRSGDISSLAIYQDYAYYSSKENELDIMFLYSTTKEKVNVTYMKIKAVGIYDIDLQPMEKNNCTDFNGGCEQICTPTGSTTMICECSRGYTLQPDNKGCSSVPERDNVIFLPDQDHDNIHQLTMDGQYRTLKIPGVDQPMSVMYDHYSDKVYWTNEWYSEIMSYALNSTEGEPELIYRDWFSEPIGLAFDYSSGLLYFTTEQYWFPGYIACVHPHVGNSIAKTLVHNVANGQSIALYPSKGLMVWTDVPNKDGLDESYIGIAQMNGEARESFSDTILVSNDIKSPDGIVIQYSTDTVYWADADKSTIEYVQLDGTGRGKLLEEADAGLVGLDISPPYLYYVGRNKKQVSRFNMDSKQFAPFMNDIHFIGRTESLRAYPEQTQPLNTGCNDDNGACELFCLPKESGFECGCPDYDSLLADKKSCKYHVSCTRDIPNAYLEKRCLGHATGTCDYSCANGYEKRVPKLICDSKGNWNHEVRTVCENVLGTCSAVIPHGHVSPNCSKRIDAVCTFVCNPGYVENPDIPNLTCLQTSAWSKPVSNLCIPVSKPCPATLNNAVIDPMCKVMSGVACSYQCNNGFEKMEGFNKLVCLSNGEWSHNGEVCRPALKCSTSFMNGAFEPGCLHRIGDYCKYSCKAGYAKNTVVEYLYCQQNRVWNYALDKLCTKAMASCNTKIKDGSFDINCQPRHGLKCTYSCDPGFYSAPSENHMLCYNGNWTIDTDHLCLKQMAPAAQTGVEPGVVVGATFATVIVTAIVVLIVIFLVYTLRCKGDGQYENTNIRFKRFEDPQPPPEKGITEFSNPMASQQDKEKDGWTTASVKAPSENVYTDLSK